MCRTLGAFGEGLIEFEGFRGEGGGGRAGERTRICRRSVSHTLVSGGHRFVLCVFCVVVWLLTVESGLPVAGATD